MKKNKLLNKLLFVLGLPILILSCDGDEDDAASTSIDFGSIASSYKEADGTGTLTIPFRNASASTANKLDVVFGGTATEGEDFDLVGITQEGVQLSIIDDNKFEENQTIRVQLASSSIDLTGNSIHTVTIISNCADTDDLTADYFVHGFSSTEIYAPDDLYGPYVIEWEQDETDPNKYWTDNFWDSGLNAYIVYDPATKKVSFPQQIPDASRPTRIITSDPVTIVDNCKFTITTYYRGFTWDYEFVRE